MRFANPEYLFLVLLLIPCFFYGRGSGGRIKFSGIESFKKIGAGSFFNPRSILLLLRVIALVFFIIALARPQSGKNFSEISSSGIDIVLAIDTSGSMNALDFKIDDKRVNRLRIVKDVVRDFIDKRPHDRMGLIVFGDEAFTQCPLTLDHGILVEFLKKVKIGMVGQATAVGQAIGTGVNRIKDIKSKSKIIILLTDGRNNSGRIDPVTAAKLSKNFGIKVYTIGVGTRGKAPFLQETFFGRGMVYKKVDIDEDTLKEIASITGGKYYRATNTKELNNIYSEIDKLEKSEIKVKEYTEYYEKFYWFILIGLVFLILEIVLANSKLRKIP